MEGIFNKIQYFRKANKISVSFELKARDSDLVEFFENRTKLKVPSEIRPPLRMNKPMVESRNVI